MIERLKKELNDDCFKKWIPVKFIGNTNSNFIIIPTQFDSNSNFIIIQTQTLL
jgi:hypothetical protein